MYLDWWVNVGELLIPHLQEQANEKILCSWMCRVSMLCTVLMYSELLSACNLFIVLIL